MRISLTFILILGIWILSWIAYMMIGYDPVINGSLFSSIALVLLTILLWKQKAHPDLRYIPPISQSTTLILCIGVTLIFFASIYYSPIKVLFWNVGAMIALVSAYYITISDHVFEMP
ncbi:MAG: hypothetical protein P1Q69_17130 [Candidatus Thorarchaeota archaeon]|nr:hypothetical protein [Candidatus Thorarchaeota archaeon]